MPMTFETFRGDVAELEKMAHESWRDEYAIDSYPNLYSPKYFDYLFGGLSPEQKDHCIGAYEGERLMAFMAAIHRRFFYKGETLRAALACLLVTRKEAFRKGSALGLTAKALELNKKHGYDFAMLYLETGHRSSKMLAKLKAAGNPVQRIKRMNVIVRPLSLQRIFDAENVKWYEKIAMKALRLDGLNKSPTDPAIRLYKDSDLDACLELMNGYRDTVTLTRAFDRAELARELSYGGVSHTLVWEKNGVPVALANWALVEHVGKLTQPWAWLNHVHLNNLDALERRELIRAFLVEADKQGAAGVVEWAKNYYPKAPLWRNRFIPYPRGVDMLSWTFKPGLDLSDIPDVLEAQI